MTIDTVKLSWQKRTLRGVRRDGCPECGVTTKVPSSRLEISLPFLQPLVSVRVGLCPVLSPTECQISGMKLALHPTPTGHQSEPFRFNAKDSISCPEDETV